MFRKLAATVAVSTALMTSQAWSLGLGELKTESGLNQPLNAEIVLLSSKELQESDLRAKIASFEAYERYGVTREPFHSLLRFEVYSKADGSKAVRVSSDSPIKEPYVNIIIELDWPQGKLMREYTLLLDPPVFNKTTPVVSTEPSQTQVTPTQRPATVTEEVARTPTTTSQTQSQPQEEPDKPQQSPTETTTRTEATTQRRAAPVFDGNSWSVGRGQTLWSIASQVRPNNATVQQTLIALYRNNPDAFINNDVNRLKAGYQLKVPEQSYIDSISHAEALRAYRASLGANQAPLDVRKTVSETQARDDSSSQGGRLSIASVEDSSLNQAGGSETDAESVSELQSEVNTLREAVETLKLQNQQLKEELQVKDDLADTGVQVEDDTLAVLSGSADVAEDTLPIETPEEPSVTEVADNAQEPVVEEEKKPEPQLTQNDKSNKESFYQAEGFWYWAGGGLLALLVLAGGAVYWRNRQPPEDGESGLIPSFGDSGRKKEPASPRDSFLSKDKMTLEESSSDPVGEADILIARGKMTEAKNVLEKALSKTPKNDEIRVKYMEILASQKNAQKFHELKKGLSKDFDHDSKLGLKVASLTSLVEPPKPAEPVVKQKSLPDEDDVFGYDDENKGKEVNVDLSAELEATEEPEVETTSSSDSLDFDLSDFEKEVEATAQEDKVKADSVVDTAEASDSGLEFSLDSDDENLVTQEPSESSATSVAEESGVSEDEVQTKLELAKAYIEMGDEESAKDILQEVQKEGNAKQSEEAGKLLAKH
ncbi:FimV/HubP family polar landmark protein [Kangiella koreensis]|uniref:Tfp pilus assembly protein FimV-like protein n=1 Tax=Kangiella koreensis (strain DSM 16069 / JCM 12317 / KCTC 12182 / SW-125) TaxID=523791 RepID=C7RCA6_KANKD|nr:FimV/HubP family polar landmark protein [Kangiella koreensis]ACV26898.1 Tfp pilus assembly protein FimV-like protein [Kangiella koreensis DSM 16069]